MIYFVSYVVVDRSSLAYGNVDVRVDGPITTMDDVRGIERTITADLIRKGGPYGGVLILNYIALSNE